MTIFNAGTLGSVGPTVNAAGRKTPDADRDPDIDIDPDPDIDRDADI